VASRRAPAILVVLVGQTIGLVAVAVVALALREAVPSAASIAWAAAAGACGIVGLVAFYRALSIGRMGIVAPIAGVLGAMIPVLVGDIAQGLPTAVQGIGIACAILSVVLITRPGDEPAGPNDRRALALAISAGAGFGLFITLLHQAGDASIPWLLVSTRTTSVAILVAGVLLTRDVVAAQASWVGPAALAGAFDVVGNAFFVAASQAGRLDVAAVTSSLYPIATVVLARVLLGERFARVHVAGIVVAAAAIVCITAG
jgi:drug/metabolite transporter (DMT)-like permease